jgi:integrase
VKAGANAKERFVERAEFDRFLPEIPSQIIRDVALWAYGTGMRLSSILSLRWDGYDRESKTIRLHGKDSKTGKGVVIPLKGWPELAAVIDRRVAERLVGCPLIFHRAGRRVGDFWLTWDHACLRAEVRVLSIHDLRRVAVRNMVRAGVPERVAMAISGHRTRAIFDRYNIVSEADLALALERRAAYEEGLVSRK